jgi:hypothetical protein
MEGLIKKGLLCARTAANEWIVPDNEDEPMTLDGYVVSFVPFHEARPGDAPAPVPSGVAGLLRHRATTLEPQWDLAHRGLYRIV